MAAAAVVEGMVGRALLAAANPTGEGQAAGSREQLFCDVRTATYDNPVDDVS